MSYHQLSIYKGCTVVVLVLLLLSIFCLTNGEVGTGSFYLCIFSLIIDIPFLGFLIYKLIRTHRQMRKTKEEDSKS